MRRVRVRLAVWIVLLAVATAAFAFVAVPRDGGNPFRAYGAAPLAPGVGLGDLHVGATPLGAFVERFGVGRPAALYGDDTALEFASPRAGLSFTFVADGECFRIVQAMAGTGLRALRSPRPRIDRRRCNGSTRRGCRPTSVQRRRAKPNRLGSSCG